MKRRDLVWLLITSSIFVPGMADAQRTDRQHVIGIFTAGKAISRQELAPLVEGLEQLGWVEGTNVAFESRSAEDQLGRLPELASELVGLKVDVIVAMGTLAPLALKRATSTIPIVMANAGDPIATGLVASLAEPGGNVTGLSLMAPDLGAKRLGLLRELIPGIVRVAILWNGANPYPAYVYNETRRGASELGIELQSLEVRTPADLGPAFESAERWGAGALITVEDPLTYGYRRQLVEFAASHHLPTVYGLREFADAGGLFSYGASIADLQRRAAGYVDKILKGKSPAQLPVEQPTKFELVINLRTAKALGLSVPPSILARADELIE